MPELEYYIAFGKDADGYHYDCKSRKTGKMIFKLSVIISCISFIIQMILLCIKLNLFVF